jgi:hypothetical protein
MNALACGLGDVHVNELHGLEVIFYKYYFLCSKDIRGDKSIDGPLAKLYLLVQIMQIYPNQLIIEKEKTAPKGLS